jgi:MinD-like ATPase involved in chromosome partitioning or flagellar assembly
MSDNHFSGADRAAGYGIESLEATQKPPATTWRRDEEPEAAEPAPVITAPPSVEAIAPAPEYVEVAEQLGGQVIPVPTSSAEIQVSPADVLAGLTRSDLRTASRPVAKTGMRGFWARLGVKLEPSAAEKAQLEAAAEIARDEEIIRQATYTRPVGILVGNRKGNASKTTVALGLGGTLASCRGGGVAIVEVAEDPGTLTLRAEGTPRRGVGQLVADHAEVRNPGQLAGYTAPQTSYARVIGSTGPRPALTGEAVENVVRVVDSHFDMRVMDSGNQYTSPAFEAAVAAADVLVIPTLNATDTATQALALLDTLRAQGGHAAELADRAVVLVITDGRREIPAVAEGVAQAIAQARVGEVLTIPFDEHLAERGQITLSQLHPNTYRAFVAAGAAVIRALEPVTT